MASLLDILMHRELPGLLSGDPSISGITPPPLPSPQPAGPAPAVPGNLLQPPQPGVPAGGGRPTLPSPQPAAPAGGVPEGILQTQQPSFSDKLFAGGISTALSPDQNKQATRQALLNAGLATLAGQGTGLQAIAQGVLSARMMAEKRRAGEEQKTQRKGLATLLKGPLTPNSLSQAISASLESGDLNTAKVLIPAFDTLASRTAPKFPSGHYTTDNRGRVFNTITDPTTGELVTRPVPGGGGNQLTADVGSFMVRQDPSDPTMDLVYTGIPGPGGKALLTLAGKIPHKGSTGAQLSEASTKITDAIAAVKFNNTVLTNEDTFKALSGPAAMAFQHGGIEAITRLSGLAPEALTRYQNAARAKEEIANVFSALLAGRTSIARIEMTKKALLPQPNDTEEANRLKFEQFQQLRRIQEAIFSGTLDAKQARALITGFGVPSEAAKVLVDHFGAGDVDLDAADKILGGSQ